jgi:hypothetical protein
VDPLRHAVTLAAVAQASESLPHNSSATVRRLASTTPRLHAVGSCCITRVTWHVVCSELRPETSPLVSSIIPRIQESTCVLCRKL